MTYMTRERSEKAMNILSHRFGSADSHFEGRTVSDDQFSVTFVCWDPSQVNRPRVGYVYSGSEYAVSSIAEARRYAADKSLLSIEEACALKARLGL